MPGGKHQPSVRYGRSVYSLDVARRAKKGCTLMSDLFHNILRDEADYARNRAAWEGASAVERATFGKIFSAIEGVLALIALFGCFFISNAMQNQFLLYVCGIIWLIPFIAAGTLLARFRHGLFVRVRGIISGFLGGPR
jgi:hypothetical protein